MATFTYQRMNPVYSLARRLSGLQSFWTLVNRRVITILARIKLSQPRCNSYHRTPGNLLGFTMYEGHPETKDRLAIKKINKIKV
jgi:hypothetical protein